MPFLRLSLLCILALSCFRCEDDDDFVDVVSPTEPDNVAGLNYVEATGGNVDSIYQTVTTALTANANISIVATVDHAANARSAGGSLRPTRLVLFGNPRLGTPLMQINPQAGLDLPQRMLVYQANDNDAIVAYNGTDYLASRHGVGAASTLATISGALADLATNAAGSGLVSAAQPTVGLNAGVVARTASGTVGEVYGRLRTAVVDNPNLQLVAELDHQANAASVNLELPAIRLIVFGNPVLGTPLLREAQSIGLDLPQKMLVYDNGDGTVTVAYNDIRWLAERHGVSSGLGELDRIESALADLTATALGN